MNKTRVFILFLALSITPVSAGNFPGERWEHASAGEAGWDEDKLADACRLADDLGTEALFVIHEGKVVLECGNPDKPFRVRSMRKSLLNALLGRLIDQGRLASEMTLEQLGIDDKTPLTALEKEATLGDLMKSRSGIYLPAVNSTNDSERPARGAHRPGAAWFYNNWDFNVLGTIVEKASGQSLFELFRDEIALPLGMQDYSLQHTFYDHENFTRHPAFDFRMSARDLARFGLLYVNGGLWGERRILSDEWIEDSFFPHSRNAPEEQDYGYLWWTQSPVFGVDERPVIARGWGYQWLWLYPEHEIVIVHQTDYWLLPVRDALGLLPEPEQAYRVLQTVLSARPAS